MPGRPHEFSSCDVIELRQYTLRPGTFDRLLDLFQTSLIAGLEESGMRLGGLFQDCADPDRFVWFRAFASMDQRRQALEDFYYGPVWRAHREIANATMIDSDDVLLLRPTEPEHRPAPSTSVRPVQARPTVSPVRAIAEVVCYPAESYTEAWLSAVVHTRLERVLGVPVAAWRTEPAANTFPGLPVREDHAFVWLAMFEDDVACQAAFRRLAMDRTWSTDIRPRIEQLAGSLQRLTLQPTTHSQHPALAAAHPW